jgi:hypothetical protein
VSDPGISGPPPRYMYVPGEGHSEIATPARNPTRAHLLFPRAPGLEKPAARAAPTLHPGSGAIFIDKPLLRPEQAPASRVTSTGWASPDQFAVRAQ